MDPEKRERLINAALEEFGNHEFDKASTNVIVKNAGISIPEIFDKYGETHFRKLENDEAIADFKRDTKAEMVDIEVIVENN
jgi:shikimate kinase